MDIGVVAAKIRDWYKRIKFAIVSCVLVLTVIGSLATPRLSYGEKLLVFGVCGAFGIILEILHSIENRLLVERKAVEFGSLADALPTIREIVRTAGQHTIEILASDGGYIANDLIPRIQQEMKQLQNEVVIRIRLVNQNSPLSSLMPVHWPLNVEGNLKKLMFSSPKLKIEPLRYDYLPCVAGVLIDSHHLFLGFYAWESANNLTAAERPHVYYERGDPKDEKYFTLFESWSRIAPCSSGGP